RPGLATPAVFLRDDLLTRRAIRRNRQIKATVDGAPGRGWPCLVPWSRVWDCHPPRHSVRDEERGTCSTCFRICLCWSFLLSCASSLFPPFALSSCRAG